MRSSSIIQTFRRTPRRFSTALFVLAVALGLAWLGAPAAKVARAGAPALFSQQALSAGSAGSPARATALTTLFQTCTSPAARLVTWLRGEGNANDPSGGNHGSLQGGLAFAAGRVGQAFDFDGVDDHIRIPARPSLNLGTGNGLTIEGWLNPSSAALSRTQPLVEWNSNTGLSGVHLWTSYACAPNCAGTPGSIYANLVGADNVAHAFNTPPNTLAAERWQHVALTYDKASGQAQIYLDGTVAYSGTPGSFTPQTSYDLYLGLRPSGASEVGTRYKGLLDELSLYNRALTAEEIKAIVDAGSAGKCAPPNTAPRIVTLNTPVPRQQGSTGLVAQLATVSDNEAPAGQLTVTVADAPVGINISDITNDEGLIRAKIDTTCNVPTGSGLVTLRVSDGALSSTAQFTVSSTPNTPPALGNYPASTTNAGSNLTSTPSAPPTDNGTIASLTATASGFTGTLTANPATGVVTIANAGPPGNHTLTITAVDNCGATTGRTLALTVNALPTIVSGTVAFQQGTPLTTVRIATVSDANQPANTLSVIATPATGSGVTVNNLSIAPAGEVSASIAASCEATISTFGLTVANRNNTTATALLTVNITSNTAPNQGAYPATTLAYSTSRTVAPNAQPRDNGAITGITATASAGFTGSLSVNQTTGLVMISDARPAGVYTVTVEATDNCHAKAASVFRLIVSQLSTNTTLAVTPGLYIEGHPVNLTTQVTATQPNAGVPTGSVTFYDGTNALGTVDLDAAGRAALATLNIGPGARGITAVYNGDRNFLISTSTPVALTVAFALANVSAATYRGETLAAEQIVAAFGTHLATGALAATALPLPTVLAGTAVRVRDSLGEERLAPLFFVSPSQVNYLVPPGTAQGAALITIFASDGSTSMQPVQIVAVNPGLFSADTTGKGAPAAVVLRVRADGTQVFEPAARREQGSNNWVPVPIELGPETDQVFLVLFGTGVRFRTSLAAVTAKIGTEEAPVSFAGPQGRNEGLDQLNLRLPRTLAGRGNADVNLLADGKAANALRVNIR